MHTTNPCVRSDAGFMAMPPPMPAGFFCCLALNVERILLQSQHWIGLDSWIAMFWGCSGKNRDRLLAWSCFFDILEQHQKHNIHFSPGYLRVVIICHHMSSYHEHNTIQQTYCGINASIKTWFGGRDFVSFSAVFVGFVSDDLPHEFSW